MRSCTSAAMDEMVLERLRALPAGVVADDHILALFQQLVQLDPGRGHEALYAIAHLLPTWTFRLQVAAGCVLFPLGGQIRRDFMAALGTDETTVSLTLEHLLHQPGNEDGFEEALARVTAFGEVARSTFVAHLVTAALIRAMAAKGDTTLLSTLAQSPALEYPETHNTLGLAMIFYGWWTCVVAVRHDTNTPQKRPRGHIGRAIDILMQAGVPLQEEGEPCDGVAAALAFQDEEALSAFLERGAEWEGLTIPDSKKALLEAHPAWRRRQLGNTANSSLHKDGALRL